MSISRLSEIVIPTEGFSPSGGIWGSLLQCEALL
jgi:hypothetical protein